MFQTDQTDQTDQIELVLDDELYTALPPEVEAVLDDTTLGAVVGDAKGNKNCQSSKRAMPGK